MEQHQPRPQNYLVFSILTTIFCCQITGIISIVYAAQVNSLYSDQRYEAALKASSNAKTWAIVGLVIGIVTWIAVLAIYGFAIFAILAGGGEF